MDFGSKCTHMFLMKSTQKFFNFWFRANTHMFLVKNIIKVFGFWFKAHTHAHFRFMVFNLWFRAHTLVLS